MSAMLGTQATAVSPVVRETSVLTEAADLAIWVMLPGTGVHEITV